eukprot:TRINITY_DN8151_c0_g1_i3.p2 TRINITY_DN8151_c0_g1~~TRINITY_DN8151_c0_g1_i3.p2  ORF type:complete len:307 (+),score=31.43 TRINITY_DN8151_c0_g1_i3:1105-2025(+)
MGNFKRAVDNLERAREIRIKIFGGLSGAVADTIELYGRIAERSGDLKTALSKYSEVLKLRTALHMNNDKHEDILRVTDYLLELHRQMSENLRNMRKPQESLRTQNTESSELEENFSSIELKITDDLYSRLDGNQIFLLTILNRDAKRSSFRRKSLEDQAIEIVESQFAASLDGEKRSLFLEANPYLKNFTTKLLNYSEQTGEGNAKVESLTSGDFDSRGYINFQDNNTPLKFQQGGSQVKYYVYPESIAPSEEVVTKVKSVSSGQTRIVGGSSSLGGSIKNRNPARSKEFKEDSQRKQRLDKRIHH